MELGSFLTRAVGYRGSASTFDSLDKNLTVADVVAYEVEELGNEYLHDQAYCHGVDLNLFPARHLLWVCGNSKDAERYLPSGNPDEEDDHEMLGEITEEWIESGLVLANDEDGGCLVLLASKDELIANGWNHPKATKSIKP